MNKFWTFFLIKKRFVEIGQEMMKISVILIKTSMFLWQDSELDITLLKN